MTPYKIQNRIWTGLALAAVGSVVAFGDWTTSGNDAQRSSWVRSDAKISIDSMRKPGFQLTWRVKLDNQAKLTAPVLLDRYIGYRGFRSLGFAGAGSDKIYAIDTDLGRIEWRKEFTQPCAGGINVTRPTSANFPPAALGGRGSGTGRGGPAKSSVGQPGLGAVTVPPTNATVAPAAPVRPAAAARRATTRPIRAPELVYSLLSDGMLRRMYVSNGSDAEPPHSFLASNSSAYGLIVVNDVAYASTGQGCGGPATGISALDLSSRQVTTWKSSSEIAGSGGFAIAPNGMLYAATTAGELVALEPATLKVKDSYKAGSHGFTSSPGLFQYKKKNLIAASTKDGSIHLLDTTSLGAALSTAGADAVPGALASWQEPDGNRWVLTPLANAIGAWKVIDQELKRGWVSREITSPLPPIIMNGVVFVLSGGAKAVLYALDGASGKELWDSRQTIAAPGRGIGLSAGGSQVFVATSDGAMYAFGFPIEH